MSKAGYWAGIPSVQPLFFCQGPSKPRCPLCTCLANEAVIIIWLGSLNPATAINTSGSLRQAKRRFTVTNRFPSKKAGQQLQALASALLEQQMPLQWAKPSGWQHYPRDTYSFNVSRCRYRNKMIQMLFFPLHISVSTWHCLCSIARQRFCRFKNTIKHFADLKHQAIISKKICLQQADFSLKLKALLFHSFFCLKL